MDRYNEIDDAVLSDMFAHNVYDNIEYHNERAEAVMMSDKWRENERIPLFSSGYLKEVMDLAHDLNDLEMLRAEFGGYPHLSGDADDRSDKLLLGLSERYTKFGPRMVVKRRMIDVETGEYIKDEYGPAADSDIVFRDLKNGFVHSYGLKAGDWQTQALHYNWEELLLALEVDFKKSSKEAHNDVPFDEIIPILEVVDDHYIFPYIKADVDNTFKQYVEWNVRNEFDQLSKDESSVSSFYERVRDIDCQFMAIGGDEHITEFFYNEEPGYRAYIDEKGWKKPASLSDLDLLYKEDLPVDEFDQMSRGRSLLSDLEIDEHDGKFAERALSANDIGKVISLYTAGDGITYDRGFAEVVDVNDKDIVRYKWISYAPGSHVLEYGDPVFSKAAYEEVQSLADKDPAGVGLTSDEWKDYYYIYVMDREVSKEDVDLMRAYSEHRDQAVFDQFEKSSADRLKAISDAIANSQVKEDKAPEVTEKRQPKALGSISQEYPDYEEEDDFPL